MKEKDLEMSALRTTILTVSIYLDFFFALIFGKKISSNQGKWTLFYGGFMLVLIICVTKVLMDFRGFAPTLHPRS